MALLSTNYDYSDRDKASLDARLDGLVDSVFSTWSNKSKANVGNLLKEMIAFIGDVLNFTQDNQARESRIVTAIQRRSMLALVKLIGYVPAGATAAQSTVTFTLSAAVPVGRTVTFNLPANPTPTNPTTALTNDVDDPQPYQLIGSPVVIAAGNTTGVGVMENSVRQGPETFTSTGLPDQACRLSQTPYLDDSAVVTASDGAYTQVTSFLQSTSTDKHFTVSVDENDVATIAFGNGTNGKIPVGTISIDYKTGGGEDGTVIANGLVLQGNYVDSTGAPVTVTITSTAATGADRDSIEEIREDAPESLRVSDRTVCREDFEINARKVSGVERSLCLTRKEDSTLAENVGDIVVVPLGSGFPTTTLKNAVITMVTTTYPQPAGFSPTAIDPTYLDVGLKAVLYLKPGYVATTVRDAIRAAVQAFFSLRNADGTTNELIDFGYNLKAASGSPSGEIALSDLFNVVRDVDGVREIGDGITDFQLSAYRVITTTTSYTGGGFPATLVQALAHTDVPVSSYDFPRLKTTVFGGSILDIDLTIDGINYPPT